MKTEKRIWTILIIIIGLVIVLTISCKKEKDQVQQGEPPVLTTNEVTGIKQTTALCEVNITSDGGATITARGVCWSITQNPTIADSKTTDGTGTDTFTSTITGLTATTTYYVKAYATNSAGTGYGNEVHFKTYTGTVNDIDGNVYNTITIGTQTWMAENLKTTKYRNGDLIGTTTPATLDITSETTPKYQWACDGNESNAPGYGRVYTWYVASDGRSVCPAGWHIPSEAEWGKLINYSGGELAADKLKEVGTKHWVGPNTGATNETGFTALPTGYRSLNGVFSEFPVFGNWWSITEHSPTNAGTYSVGSAYHLVASGIQSKSNAYAIRCLKD